MLSISIDKLHFLSVESEETEKKTVSLEKQVYGMQMRSNKKLLAKLFELELTANFFVTRFVAGLFAKADDCC